MSEWILNKTDVYPLLAKSLTTAAQNAPQHVHGFVTLIEQYRSDLFNDLKETQTQAKQRSNEAEQVKGDWEQESKARGEASEFKQKEEALKSAISSVDLLLVKLKQTVSRTLAIRTSTSKGIAALHEMEQLARTYTTGQAGSQSNRSDTSQTGSSNNRGNQDILTQAGDAYHFNLDKTSQVNQHMLDSILNQAKQNNSGASSASKVSLGNISQSSFSLLEKNGFTIQKIGPNEFSAFKEL